MSVDLTLTNVTSVGSLTSSMPKSSVAGGGKVNYKSQLEADFAKRFNLPYERQKLPYTTSHTYHPDWFVSKNAAIETKGRFTGADRGKHLVIQTQHPQFKVLLAFQDPNKKLSKKSMTTYSMWCDKHGIRWCDAKDTAAIQAFIKEFK